MPTNSAFHHRGIDQHRARRRTYADESEIEIGFALCRAAERWRRAADAALAASGLTQVQFLVLQCTTALCAESKDAISQNEVAAEAGIGKMRTSKAMRALERRGLVDRGPSASGVAYRVIVTPRGRLALLEGRSCLADSHAVAGAVREFREVVSARSR